MYVALQANGIAPFVVSAWAQPEALGVRQMLLDSRGSPLSDQVRALHLYTRQPAADYMGCNLNDLPDHNWSMVILGLDDLPVAS